MEMKFDSIISEPTRVKTHTFSPTVITKSSPKLNSQTPKIRAKRRTRSDKKTDIKVPVTQEQKQQLMIMAKLKSNKISNAVSVTQLATELVQQGLYEYETFPEIEYDATFKPVHVKLERFYVDQLFNHQLDWDASRREAAARVLTFMLQRNQYEL